jgi:hypothetical protein
MDIANVVGYRGLQHSADPEEIDDVEKYLNERIPSEGEKPTLWLEERESWINNHNYTTVLLLLISIGLALLSGRVMEKKNKSRNRVKRKPSTEKE